jgi:signal transduction histidine kinase
VFIITRPSSINATAVFIITLLLTLGATAITLFILNALLEPLKKSKQALEDYLQKRTIPSLPLHYSDEAGILMTRVQETITSLDTLLEEKKDLIGLLSHDLRTPLASILVLSRTLQREKEISADEVQGIGGMITSSVKEQMELFQKILEVLRNDDINRLHLELEEIPVDRIIDSAVDALRPLADKKRITIAINYEKHPTIRADAKMISQVIKNLVSNAIKFSHGGSTVHISAATMGDKIRIVVKDSGLGFDPADAGRLVERFTDRRKVGTDNEVSTGMGLYLSNKIMKAHLGKLTAWSEGENKGAAFTIEI